MQWGGSGPASKKKKKIGAFKTKCYGHYLKCRRDFVYTFTQRQENNSDWLLVCYGGRVKVPVGTHGPMGTHLLKKNLPTVIGKANVSLLCLKKNFEHGYISYMLIAA